MLGFIIEYSLGNVDKHLFLKECSIVLENKNKKNNV
jgi:hypothetical protein